MKHIKILILYLTYFILCLYVVNYAFAKVYEIERDGELTAIISRHNPNRIKVINDRIKRIDCNEAELSIRSDSNTGEIFLKPASKNDTFNIFITTEQGITYKLLLKAKDIISQQIFLQRKEFTLKNYSEAVGIRKEKPIETDSYYFDFEEDFKIASINLLKHMSSFHTLKEFNIIQRHSNILKYKKGLKVSWEYSYIKNDNSGISGEILYITNKTGQDVELNELDFFSTGIRAVKLDKHTLGVGESCYLYQIGGGHK